MPTQRYHHIMPIMIALFSSHGFTHFTEYYCINISVLFKVSIVFVS